MRGLSESRNKPSEVGYWKNFTSTEVSDFIEAGRNFILDVLRKKTTKIVKTFSSFKKYCSEF
jgi:hypothetical protein